MNDMRHFPPVDDEVVRAMENRLRTSGWADRTPSLIDEARGHRVSRHAKHRHRPEKDNGFGTLEGKVREVGQWLAANPGLAEHPIRPFLVREFGLSFDDAGRALHEAERLSGETF